MNVVKALIWTAGLAVLGALVGFILGTNPLIMAAFGAGVGYFMSLFP